MKSEKLRIVQIATAQPIDARSRAPILFAIVDDGNARDHVRFWNWLDKKWEPLEKFNG